MSRSLRPPTHCTNCLTERTCGTTDAAKIKTRKTRPTMLLLSLLCSHPTWRYGCERKKSSSTEPEQHPPHRFIVATSATCPKLSFIRFPELRTSLNGPSPQESKRGGTARPAANQLEMCLFSFKTFNATRSLKHKFQFY